MTDFLSLFHCARKWRRGDKSSVANRLFWAIISITEKWPGLIGPYTFQTPLPPPLLNKSFTITAKRSKRFRASAATLFFHAGVRRLYGWGGSRAICTHWFGRWLRFRGSHVQVGHHRLKTLAFFRKLLGEKESTLVEITATKGKKGFFWMEEESEKLSDWTNSVIDSRI